MTISRDISGKIDQSIAELLAQIKNVANQLAVPFFLVGAGARDLFYSALFNIKTRRATLDIDIAVRVDSWEKVMGLVDGLQATGNFKVVNRIRSRLRHTNGTLVDIVPFGVIEDPSAKVQWPASDAIMRTLGFDEAFRYSMEVQIRNEPPLDIRICTPPAMVILKLIAWDEKYPERTKDAQDVQYIMDSYLDAGNDQRLDNEDADLRQQENFDYALAGARILGRDIATIAGHETVSVIMNILERETAADSSFRLLTDMSRNPGFVDSSPDQNLALLRQLKQGIMDKQIGST